MSQTKGWMIATLSAVMSFTVGCGSRAIPYSSSSQLLGGSMQGQALSLSGTASTLAGTAGSQGTMDGTGSAARFEGPSGITTDGTNLFVTDFDASTIRKIVPSSGVVTTLAGTADTTGTADGNGTAATFVEPQGITSDGTNLYVTDGLAETIRKIVIASGEVTTLAGLAGSSGATDGAGSVARFNFPAGITTDGTNLYIADAENCSIRTMVLATAAVSTLAGGSCSEIDGTGTAAGFNFPLGITTDGTNLYVTDYQGDTVRKVVIASGAVTTLAGTAGVSGSADGVGTAAQFYEPAMVTTDGTYLYVPDSSNYTVRKIKISTGAVTTLAGTAGTAGSTDGSSPLFASPWGATVLGGKLYMTEFEGDPVVRTIQ